MVEDAQKRTGKTLLKVSELPDIRSSNFNRRSFAERTAMNTYSGDGGRYREALLAISGADVCAREGKRAAFFQVWR